jgi:hypothetical protein
MLTDTNYGVWAVKMKIILRHLGVWAAIVGEASAEEEKDDEALVAISQAVPDAVMMSIADKETAKEAWEAIKEMNVGEDRVRKARVQALKRQFDRMYMAESETIVESYQKLTTIVGAIHSLGAKLKDRVVVERLFSAVPDKFLPIVGTIEQWGDVSKMSVSEAIGRLRAFEETSKGRCRDKDGEPQLLVAHVEPRFTRAEWEAIVVEEKANNECSSSSVKKKYRSKFDKSKINCHKCGNFGHFADECIE